MKTISSFAALLLVLSVSGCAFYHRHFGPAPAATPPPIVTPDTSLAAKVISVNLTGRFVVLGFPAQQMPKINQTLFLYRDGLKVAELKVTGPQNESNIVADLVSGEARPGDTVRDQ
jgi:hypothetical protein